MGDFHTTSMCRFMVATQAALWPLATAPAATRHRRMQKARHTGNSEGDSETASVHSQRCEIHCRICAKRHRIDAGPKGLHEPDDDSI